ncbi:MAG TPA: glycosyltransferase family 4 protein [Actinomycetota bacterium]|nr:glycosyltransferase family 4 protein [Actinomycetota bacterium]
MEVPRVLVVTNDYPPQVGGIERALHALVRQLPPDRVAVYAPRSEGAGGFDAGEPYEIVRDPARFVWPTPAVARRVREVVRATGAGVVLFGDAMPLAALGPGLARRGTPYVVACHGFDYWLSLVSGPHAALRAVTRHASRVVVMGSRFLARVVRTAVPRRVPVSLLPLGVDPERFRPDLPTDDLRARHGLEGRPVVCSVGRLVRRKGHDALIRAMPRVRAYAPGATLVVVGDGPYRGRLERLAASAPAGSVVFAGEVPEEELPRYYALGDVFALPCRDRLGGLEVEGFGLVFLEAAACGRPVVVGDSGGARESLVDGVTGLLVDGRDVARVADAVGGLLADPARARAMGEAGRDRVLRSFTWPRIAALLAGWLREAADRGPGPG